MAGSIKMQADVDGLREVTLAVTAIPIKSEKWSRETADRAAAKAQAAMKAMIPLGERNQPPKGLKPPFATGAHLRDRVRIDRETASYAPGGAGGGGSYQIVVGVQEELVGGGRTGRRDPAIYYFEGTGLQGPKHQMIIKKERMISYDGAGNIYSFHKSRGQEPHPLPMRAAIVAAQRVVDGRIQQLRMRGFDVV